MRVLVTGGSGFIGTNLVHALNAAHTVVNLDITPPRDTSQHRLWRPTDILDSKDLTSAVTEFAPDAIVHLAARTDLGGRSVGDYKTNWVGTRNLIRATSKLESSPYTVYTSTQLVFAIDHSPRFQTDYRPSTAYGESKVAMETIVLSEGTASGAWTIVRPTSIWGPWFAEPYRDFFEAVMQRHYLAVSGANSPKSFGYVQNAVHILRSLLEMRANPEIDGKILWLSDYEPLFLNDFADLIAGCSGVRKPLSVPHALLSGVANLGDWFETLTSRRAPLTTFRLNNMLTSMVYDTSETERLVGQLPYDLAAGIAETVHWLTDLRTEPR